MNKLIFSLTVLLLVFSQAPAITLADESETAEEIKPVDGGTKPSTEKPDGEAGSGDEKKGEEEADC